LLNSYYKVFWLYHLLHFISVQHIYEQRLCCHKCISFMFRVYVLRFIIHTVPSPWMEISNKIAYCLLCTCSIFLDRLNGSLSNFLTLLNFSYPEMNTTC
jgi:exosortase/archaeosortase